MVIWWPALRRNNADVAKIGDAEHAFREDQRYPDDGGIVRMDRTTCMRVRYHIALTMLSVIFLASPSSIMVLSR